MSTIETTKNTEFSINASEISKGSPNSCRILRKEDDQSEKPIFPNSKLIRHLYSVQHVDMQQLEIRERVWCCAWQHTGKFLASTGEDRTVKVWKYCSENWNNREELTNKSASSSVCLEHFCTIRGDQNRSIRCVCFSPCGKYLATASFDATIIVYEYNRESNDFEELHRLEGHESEVKCCAFSISGHYLASCSRDKSVWVWKIEEDDGDGRDCEVLSILQQHTADVKFVAWHPREDILVSGGYDCQIRFYTFDGDDWTTAQAIPNAHDETIWSATFEPITGKYLASVGADKSVKIWARSPSNYGDGGATGTRETWQSWNLASTLSLANDTHWPLYSVAWSQPFVNQEMFGCTTNDGPGGILAVGGGDRIVRIFTYDEQNQALALLDRIRLDSEINCLCWRPIANNLGSLERNMNTENSAEDDEMGSPIFPTAPTTTPLQLAVAVDYGFVHLLEVGGKMNDRKDAVK